MKVLKLERHANMLIGLEALAGWLAILVTGLLISPKLAPVLLVWLCAWIFNTWLARFDTRLTRFLVALIFGLTIIALWEMIVRIYAIPPLILPAPSRIAASFVANIPLLWGDFVQTIVKGALTGWILGGAAAVLTAIAIDRSPFLQRGLLPIGNFVAALPIVGIAPILVMWFGFDWQSKAAVVVVMVFFPILVNMVAGLAATDRMQRDQMATWAAPYGQSLWKMRLPAAMPFLFNGLKITTTLALIGAIVAEFFGSPTTGMGFRISTAVGRLDLPLVWAEILVAAIAGSLFYGIVALIEKKVTFWHPSQRNQRG
ncbi:ABC transporter permease [Paracoccus onubensis]|nr:ABC transporter permease [Paracoccus onubensis]